MTVGSQKTTAMNQVESQELTLSVNKYALYIGCSDEIVHRAIKAGKIPEVCFQRGPSSNSKIRMNVALADQHWGNNYRETRRKNKTSPASLLPISIPVTDQQLQKDQEKPKEPGLVATDNPGMTYIEADRLLKIYTMKTAELKMKELDGSLVDLKTIEDAFYTHARIVRDNFVTLADRVIDHILTAETRSEAHMILQNEIESVLNSLNSMPQVRHE